MPRLVPFSRQYCDSPEEKLKKAEQFYMQAESQRENEQWDAAALAYKQAFLLGLPEAAYRLGEIYAEGKSVKVDLVQALKLFYRAGEGGVAEGYEEIGDLLMSKRVRFDEQKDHLTEAVEFYTKSADKGSPSAQFKMAMLTQQGKGVTKDPEQAARFLQMAAEQGLAPAQTELGYCHMIGMGVPIDIPRAAELFHQAAEQDQVEALFALGQLYLTGEEGLEPDHAKAVSLLERAVELKHPGALVRLGFCYYMGKGVERDGFRAANLWNQVTDGPEINYVRNALGMIYYRGDGVPQDVPRAAELWRQAAEENYTESQHNLAMLYKNFDSLLETDDPQVAPEEAVRLFTAAAASDHVHAMNQLGHCYRTGWGVEQNVETALQYYRKAAAMGFDGGELSLGKCYAEGIGVAPDPEAAIHYLSLAAQQGNPEAQESLNQLQKKEKE